MQPLTYPLLLNDNNYENSGLEFFNFFSLISKCSKIRVDMPDFQSLMALPAHERPSAVSDFLTNVSDDIVSHFAEDNESRLFMQTFFNRLFSKLQCQNWNTAIKDLHASLSGQYLLQRRGVFVYTHES